jgi:hypothetical protein
LLEIGNIVSSGKNHGKFKEEPIFQLRRYEMLFNDAMNTMFPLQNRTSPHVTGNYDENRESIPLAEGVAELPIMRGSGLMHTLNLDANNMCYHVRA